MRIPAVAAALVSLALAGAALAAGAAGRPSARTAAATRLTVTLREYAIAFSARSIAPGPVTFTVRNAGRVAHALAIGGPGLAAVRTPTIAPGAARTLTITLGRGRFRLRCPLGRHAVAGMSATLGVGGAATPPAPAPPATTTPTTTGSGKGYDDGGYYR